MSNERRLRAALQGFITKVRDSREYGTLGRVNANTTVTIVVEERPDHVYVSMNAGALITLPNVGKGRVPLREGLPVQMIRLHNGDLILDGQDDRLLEGDENAPSTEADLAYHAYLIDAVQTKLAGIEAGAEVNVNADWTAGSGDALILNKPTIPTVDAASVGGVLTGATAKTTPVDADTMPLSDSAASNALKKVTWANIKATLKTYFDALYEAVGAVATHAALTVTHGVTGAVVGTTNVQSLSNKVVNDSTFGASNTFEVGEHGGLGDADNLFVASDVDNLIRRSSWANIKSTLKTYFDTLYVPTAASWTPGIAFGGAVVGVTYGTRVARYVKNGAHCTVWGRISLTNKGTSVGSAAITGLPFTSANIAGLLFVSTARADITYNGTLSIYINPNGSTIGVEQLVGATITQLTNTAFTNTSTIQFQITYQVP